MTQHPVSVTFWTAVNVVRIAINAILNDIDNCVVSCQYFWTCTMPMSPELYFVRVSLSMSAELDCADLHSYYSVVSTVTISRNLLIANRPVAMKINHFLYYFTLKRTPDSKNTHIETSKPVISVSWSYVRAISR